MAVPGVLSDVLDCRSRRREPGDIVMVLIRRVVDRIEHHATARVKMLGEVRVHGPTEGLRINLMNPVDHNDGIVHTGQLGSGEVEGLEARRPASLESGQEAGGREHAGIAIQAETLAKLEMAQDVAQAAADLGDGLAAGRRPRVQIADDIGCVRLAGVTDVPLVEAIGALQQGSFPPVKPPADSATHTLSEIGRHG